MIFLNCMVLSDLMINLAKAVLNRCSLFLWLKPETNYQAFLFTP